MGCALAANLNPKTHECPGYRAEWRQRWAKLRKVELKEELSAMNGRATLSQLELVFADL